MFTQEKYRPPEYIESFFGSEVVHKVLNNAPLCISDFHANQKFLAGSSICVLLNSQPFIMLGYSNCESSIAVAERLAVEPELKKAILYFLNQSGFKLMEPLTLSVGTIENSDIEEHFYYNTAIIANPKIDKKKHGCIPGYIQAIFHPSCLTAPVIQQIVFYITANQTLTKCISPTASDFDSFDLSNLPQVACTS